MKGHYLVRVVCSWRYRYCA